MLCNRWPLAILAFAAACLWAVECTAVRAQVPKLVEGQKEKEADAKPVDFTTADGVEIKGKFYASSKPNPPCVILLHALGESSSNKEWTNFAKRLQEKGYAVLTFDFRGHGDSTTVQPGMPNAKNPKASIKGFWDHNANKTLIKGYSATKPRPTEIKYEQFGEQYYPMLANDICAARVFLEDQPDVNSSNLVIIGAKEGATIGALWIQGEFYRYRVKPAGAGQPAAVDYQNPQGQAIAAGIWLSISPSLGSYKTVNIAGMLDTAVKTFKTPMVFIYGEKDTKGAEFAKLCEKNLTTKAKKDAKEPKDQPFTGAVKIPGDDKVVGKNLLADSLDTTGKILDILSDAGVPSRNPKIAKRGDNAYWWSWDDSKGRHRIVSRQEGATNWEFLDFRQLMK